VRGFSPTSRFLWDAAPGVADVLGGEIPTPFGLIAHDPGYLATSGPREARIHRPPVDRRHKEALAFAVS